MGESLDDKTILTAIYGDRDYILFIYIMCDYLLYLLVRLNCHQGLSYLELQMVKKLDILRRVIHNGFYK